MLIALSIMMRTSLKIVNREMKACSSQPSPAFLSLRETTDRRAGWAERRVRPHFFSGHITFESRPSSSERN